MKPRLQQLPRINQLIKGTPNLTRAVQTSRPQNAALPAAGSTPQLLPPMGRAPGEKTLLARLPTSTVLRSYLISRVSSSPILLDATFAILKSMVNPKSVILNPDRNPFLHWLLKHTFYAQFCAGESKNEIRAHVSELRSMGYTGVILEYALEVLDGHGSTISTAAEVENWRKGMLETVDMATEGDYVALKWSGLGHEALSLLRDGLPPTPEMRKAVLEVCDLASKKGVGMLPGAEEEHTNVGINHWNLALQRRFNGDLSKRPTIYTTYQSYLLSTPSVLASHLATAAKEKFSLGVKLVRGAYLAFEPRPRVTKTKNETDQMYNGLAVAILKREWNSTLLRPTTMDPNIPFPNVALVLASHNLASVRVAQSLRAEQTRNGESKIHCAYAQLQGMADEISCELLDAAAAADRSGPMEVTARDRPDAYKSATWGTVRECLGYLLRRAAENKDAAGRTQETGRAMGREVWRRMAEMMR